MRGNSRILDPILSKSAMFRENILDDEPWGGFGVQSVTVSLDLPTYPYRPTLTIGYIDAYEQIDFLASNANVDFSIKAHASRTPWKPVIRDLGQMSNVRGVSGPASMEELSEFIHVDEVFIGDDFKEFDARNMPALRYLHTTQSLTSMNIEALSNLEFLSINMGKKKSLNANNLSSLEQLRGLAIHNADIRSLDFLSGLNRLETLSVTGSKALTDIDSVASLNCLTHLRIENCGQLRGYAEAISPLNLDSCVIVGSANRAEESVVARLN